ncbi:MAG: hypothetical protein AB1744_11495, partial [Candidatus Zixiibacteriota bacterium]
MKHDWCAAMGWTCRNCIFVSALLSATLLYGGCEQREVLPPDDEAEMRAYLTLSEDGRELFRTEGLIPGTPYTLPFGDTVYQDRVDSVWRTINDTIVWEPQQIGIPGDYSVAQVDVIDIFFVTTMKTSNGSTIEFPNERQIKRYGYFAKLGDDTKPFLGWVLWAYNSLGFHDPPITLKTRTLNSGQTLASDLSFYNFRPTDTGHWYIPLRDIHTLVHGDTVTFLGSRRENQQGVFYNTVTFDTDSGFTVECIDSIPGLFQRWADTIATRSPNPRLWNVIFIQTFLQPPNSQFVRGWCIPYRVPQ